MTPTTECYNCGRKISLNHRRCPHCGEWRWRAEDDHERIAERAKRRSYRRAPIQTPELGDGPLEGERSMRTGVLGPYPRLVGIGLMLLALLAVIGMGVAYALFNLP